MSFRRSLLAAGLLGLITTVGIAWSSAVLVDLYHADRAPRQFHSSGASPAWSYSHWRSRTAEGVLSIDSSLSGAARTHQIAIGPRWSRTSRPPGEAGNAGYTAVYEEVRGWPLLALQSVHTSTDMSLAAWTTRWGLPIGLASGIFDAPRTLALLPVWPGFAINTLALGIAWLFPIAALHRLRWVRRRRKNLCVRCAYPMESLPRCPECGTQAGVQTRSAQAAGGGHQARD